MFINYIFLIKSKKMPTKRGRKTKKPSTKKSTKKSAKSEVDQALLDNFINLQKVLTNLSVKFEDLSNNLSKLLQLFELSAKSFADKPVKVPGVDEEFLKKLDSLLDQNKTISKGIMLMEERVRGRANPVPREHMQREPMQRGYTRSL